MLNPPRILDLGHPYGLQVQKRATATPTIKKTNTPVQWDILPVPLCYKKSLLFFCK